MAASLLSLLSLLCLFLSPPPVQSASSPYLSPSTIFPNYRTMLRDLKIFVYKREIGSQFRSPPAESLFSESLLKSRFLTQDPNEAHLFFIPSISSAAARSGKHTSRLIGGLRSELPYWNRTLGSDHFYVSCAGIGPGSDRNLLELRKNAIRISCFPSSPEAGESMFVPHKDISLPPVSSLSNPSSPPNPWSNDTAAERKLCYHYYGREGDRSRSESSLVAELRGDPEFVIESSSDETTVARRLSTSKFCLFIYGGSGDLSWIGGAMRFGCVPVVVSDGPIKDLPFVDVLRWPDIAVFVGGGVTAAELREVLRRTCGEGYERRRGLGMVVSRHFSWKAEEEEPYDSFHMGLYQLWLRRHTIRYARIERL